MIQDKKVLAVIAARGGSKGLRGKNLREAGGKPLIAWSIEAGRGSRYIDRLVLSTDDDEIMAVARDWECEVPFRRPDDLAGDEARIEDALIHALDTIGDDFDYLVLLQATSPLRTSGDIDACLERCLETGAPALVSVSEAGKSPYWMYGLDADGRMRPLLEGRYSRRQDLPAVYAVNGGGLRGRDRLVPAQCNLHFSRNPRLRHAGRTLGGRGQRDRHAHRPGDPVVGIVERRTICRLI